MKELVLKKCERCRALVEVIEDCNCGDCGIRCCDQVMTRVEAKETDLGFEKHLPQIEKENDKIMVKVNHPMDEKHHIDWIACVTENTINKVFFSYNEKPECEFDYVKDSKVYVFCNEHSLWVKKVE